MPVSTPTPAVTVGRIAQIAVLARDVAASVAFYRDLLGVKPLFTVNERLAFMDCGGVRLMFSPPEVPELDHPASILYFTVGDIDSAHQALAAHGVPCEQPPQLVARMPDHELWIGEYRDPARNIFALMCEKRPARGG
jgi:methylmalonyl-CoA/ethylmalonyl-CoA epimerase